MTTPPHLPIAYLGKWPRLLVRGDPVTEQQANAIILRTTALHYLHGNDRAWNRAVHEVLGLVPDDIGYPTPESGRAVEDRLRILNLEYLTNDRIVSAYIGGPHGWCNWDGTIGCSDYNIGKWPEMEEVDAEWRKIAAAFPFLRLEAQLVTDEGDGEVAVAWRIEDGRVLLRPRPAPREYLRPVVDNTTGGFAAILAGMPGRERGVTRERLAVALAEVEADGVPHTHEWVEQWRNRLDNDRDTIRERCACGALQQRCLGDAWPLNTEDELDDHPHQWLYIATNEPWAHERCEVCGGRRVRHVRDGDVHWVVAPWSQKLTEGAR